MDAAAMISKVRKAITKAGYPDKAAEFSQMSSGVNDFEEARTIANEYVKVIL
jgi:hypothetical protein